MTTFRPPPQRHWRSYGTDPLPTAQEALLKPLSAFPSWFLRVECERCSKVRTFDEAHLSGGGAASRSRLCSPRCATTDVAVSRAGWS